MKSTACSITGSIGVSSCASVNGLKKGTSSPTRRPSSAMRSESVESTMRSITPDSADTRAAYSRSVRPASGRMFLSGTPLDPPRAGTRASTRLMNWCDVESGPCGPCVLHKPDLAPQAFDGMWRRQVVGLRRRGTGDVADVKMVGGVVASNDLEARSHEIRDHRRLCQVVRMIDLDRVLDRPVTKVGGAKVHDVHEQKPARRQELPYTVERPGGVEEVIDRLTEHDRVEAPCPKVNILHKALDRLEAQGLRLNRFERRRVDDGGAQIESTRERV